MLVVVVVVVAPVIVVVVLVVVVVVVVCVDGGFTVIDANWNTLLRLALSWTVVRAAQNVVTVKLALVAPPGTVTLAGTLAALGWLLPRLTATPPVGAALANVTVPVAVLAPVTLVGFTVSAVSAGSVGYTVNVAAMVTPPPDTEIAAVVGTETGVVTISKRPKPVTAVTVTVAGTLASAGLLLVT